MLYLIKLEDGRERALDLSSVEFEAVSDVQDASKKQVTFYKKNGEQYSTVITETDYERLIEALKKNNELLS